MADIQKLIAEILSDAKSAGKKAFDTTVYHDEPIIRTAAQMANYTPPQYREMRKIAKSVEAYRQSEAWLFYSQGKFMESFEDDFYYHGEFVRYFPTYQSMTDLQLRGYFSWRARVRRGIIEETCLSFAFVYLYELLNLIGVPDARAGFDAIKAFWTDYRKIDSRIDSYVRFWLNDFVIYYNLDRELLEGFSDFAFDGALLVLFNCSEHSEDEIFSALNSLSSYNFENSRFYREYPADVRAVVSAVFVSMAEYCEKNRKYSLCEKLFGRIYSGPYRMFGSAVFYDRSKYADFEYTIDDIYKFKCKNGNWSCERFYGVKSKNRELGSMMKAIDCVMRQKYNFSSPLKQEKMTKILLSVIEKEIDAFLSQKSSRAAPKIEIDVSKLDEIMRESLETRDKLITEEEKEDEPLALPEESEEDGVCLSETESELVRRLLRGEDVGKFVREKGVMLSVAVDSVNEKLYDRFGDTVIVFDGDSPEVLEDYADELKGIVK